jgi:two-component system cell cycle response regulator
MKILVAEDSASARLLIERALVELGHDCILAEDGDQAWERFQGSHIDVVISDWMMPGMDGDELCRRIRADPSAPYAYFIILTSLEGRHHVINGMRAGVDDYLSKPFDGGELEARLIAAARVTTLHRRLAHQGAELERLNATLFEDSRHDHLTGLGNRKRLDEDLAEWTARAERSGDTFSIALFDIDNFKRYNDTFGHLAGDDVLRSVAGTLQRTCRLGDAAYRYGGEELLVALAGQPLSAAKTTGERMREAIEMMAIPFGAPTSEVLTVSVGVAELQPGDNATFSLLIARADAALYQAKQCGRNRVVASEHKRRNGSVSVVPANADPEPDRLLLIEDNTTQALMIQGMLKSAGSRFAITHVETLSEAKRFLHSYRVACVLLDLTLPDASGLDGLLDLRGVSSEAPIVVVTADDDESHGIRAVQAGAQDYFIKGRMTGDDLSRAVLYAIERQRGEVQLAHRALHDQLTGLPNRTLFLDRLQQALEQSERETLSIAVLFLDLDGFKSVNDDCGHAAGDLILQAVGRRLLASVRPGDTAARFGGDEFTVLSVSGGTGRAQDATDLAGRLAADLSVPFRVGPNEIRLSASIGVALAHGSVRNADAVVADADEAMYHAKRQEHLSWVLSTRNAPEMTSPSS